MLHDLNFTQTQGFKTPLLWPLPACFRLAEESIAWFGGFGAFCKVLEIRIYLYEGIFLALGICFWATTDSEYE